MSGPSTPYCGPAPIPEGWLAQWNADPMLMLGLLIAAIVLRNERAVTPWVGLAGLAILFISPLCALTSALFSARVAHHVVMTALLAPLIAPALPRLPGGMWVWTAIHALIFWFWHAPPAYAAALSSDLIFWAMQFTLLGSAVALWATVRRMSGPAAIGGLLATMVQMGLLGALLTFAGTPLYAPHAVTTLSWGLTPLEDQQIAGLIMWIGGGAVYLAAAMAVGWRWLGAHESRVPA